MGAGAGAGGEHVFEVGGAAGAFGAAGVVELGEGGGLGGEGGGVGEFAGEGEVLGLGDGGAVGEVGGGKWEGGAVGRGFGVGVGIEGGGRFCVLLAFLEARLLRRICGRRSSLIEGFFESFWIVPAFGEVSTVPQSCQRSVR